MAIDKLKRVSTGAVVAAVVLAFVAAVPAKADEKALYEAAKKEGQVVWYTTLIVKQAVRPLVKAFTAKYPGVKVRYSRANSTNTAIKILSEARAKKVRADVFDGTSTAEALKDAGVVKKWMPDAAANLPSEYKDPDGYWTASNLYFLAPGINTKLVSKADAPRTFEDLLNPKWKGKLGWSPRSSTSGAAGFIGNVLHAMGEKKGMTYLRKLSKQNIINVSASARKVLDQAITGEFSIALQIFNHHTAISAAKGAPVDWVRMEPVTNVISAVGLLKAAPHPNAGKLLIEFLLSTDGQKVFQKANYLPSLPAIPAKTPTLKPKEGGFKVNVMSQKFVNKQLPKWKKIYNELFR